MGRSFLDTGLTLVEFLTEGRITDSLCVMIFLLHVGASTSAQWLLCTARGSLLSPFPSWVPESPIPLA